MHRHGKRPIGDYIPDVTFQTANTRIECILVHYIAAISHGCGLS
jgi:hypothetical protein